MMFALIVYACVSGTGCPPFVLTDRIESQMACAAGPNTIVTIEKFMSAHPRWKLENFRCAPVERLDFYLGRNQA